MLPRMRPYIFSFRIGGVVVRAEPSWLFLALLVGSPRCLKFLHVGSVLRRALNPPWVGQGKAFVQFSHPAAALFEYGNRHVLDNGGDGSPTPDSFNEVGRHRVHASSIFSKEIYPIIHLLLQR